MIFEISTSGNPLFSKIHPVLADILRAVAEDPWERYPDGSARLLPPPGEDEELCRDWEDHVQPELRHGFDSDRALVFSDLEAMKPGRGKNAAWSLEIPFKHVDAWLITLNALRLALVSENCFSEDELAHKTSPDLTTERGLALMSVNFYAFVQECLIRAMEVGDAAEDGTPGTE